MEQTAKILTIVLRFQRRTNSYLPWDGALKDPYMQILNAFLSCAHVMEPIIKLGY